MRCPKVKLSDYEGEFRYGLAFPCEREGGRRERMIRALPSPFPMYMYLVRGLGGRRGLLGKSF